MMDFHLAEGCKEYTAGFEELLKERGYALKSGIPVSMELAGDDRILVSYADKKAQIKAPHRAALFRGLMQLVKRLEKEGEQDSFSLDEKICLKKNGAMVDCSRNSVLQKNTVKQLLRLQAALGMNTLMLYTEDTYTVEEYPYFGACRGRYSKEDLKELDSYAAELGIELVPCIQALAHLQTTLRWPEMLKLRDTEDILLADSEEVYDFIRACIASVAECFQSRRIHLGMDEAWSLGLGSYLHKNGYHSKDEIMTKHLEKVTAMCREHELEPMIWSDMYFRMLSPENEYYDVPIDSDLKNAAKPPEGVTLVYWDYYHQDKQFYKDYIGLHRQLAEQVIFAGGLWTWNGIAPNYTTAWKNSKEALAACRETGLFETICTMWQDDGAETPIFAGLPALVMYAENGYGDGATEECIKEQFEFLTGSSYEAYMLLDRFDYVKGCEASPHFDNPSKFLLYQDALTGIFDGQIQNLSMNHYYEELEQELKTARVAYALQSMEAKRNEITETVLDMYEVLAKLLSQKAELGLQIRRAYEKKDKDALRRLAEQTIPECMALTDEYRELREEVWMLESRIFGFEVLDIRLNGLKGRLKSAARRISLYVENHLDSLPELEEEMLIIRPENEGENRKLCSANCWRHIISASNI